MHFILCDLLILSVFYRLVSHRCYSSTILAYFITNNTAPHQMNENPSVWNMYIYIYIYICTSWKFLPGCKEILLLTYDILTTNYNSSTARNIYIQLLHSHRNNGRYKNSTRICLLTITHTKLAAYSMFSTLNTRICTIYEFHWIWPLLKAIFHMKSYDTHATWFIALFKVRIECIETVVRHSIVRFSIIMCNIWLSDRRYRGAAAVIPALIQVHGWWAVWTLG